MDFGHPTFDLVVASLLTGSMFGSAHCYYQVGMNSCNMN